MTCQDARERLSALLDDALEAPERQTLEAHLAGCADCRRELAALRGTVALLGRLPPAHAPAGFVDRVTAAVHRPPWPRRLLDAVFVPLRVKLPLEAAAVLLVGVSALYVYQRTPEVREVARQEAREVPAPVAPAPALPPPAATPATPAPAPPPPAARARAEQAKPKHAPSQPEVAAKAPQAPAEATGPATPAPAATASSDVREAPVAPALGKTAELEAKKEALTASRADTPVASAPAGSEEKAKTSEPSTPRDALGAGSRFSAPAPAKPPSAGTAVPDARSGVGGAAGSAAPAPAPMARQLMRAVDASGRLAVPAREPAESAIDALLGRLGARRVARRLEGDQGLVLIDVLVPAARYPELIEGLGRIGRWVTEYESRTLPAEVRVEVAIRVEP